MRLSRRTLSAVTVVCLSAVAVAACGPAENVEQQVAKVGPKLELRQASEALANEQAVATTITLGGSAEDVGALLNDSVDGNGPSAADSAEELTGEQVQALLASSLSMTFDHGPDARSVEDDSGALTVRYAGGDLLEVRNVSGSIYALLNTGKLLAQHPEFREGFAEAAGMAEMVPGSAAFLNGQWVTIPAADLEELSRLADPTADATAAAHQAAKAVAELKAAASRLVEKSDLLRDEQDPTHLVGTVKVADVQREAMTLMTVLADDFPALKAAQGQLGNATPGTATVKVDFWVKDGKLNAVELDMAQFGGTANGRVPVRAEFAPAKPVTAPTGAVKVDLSPIMGMLSSPKG